MDSQDSRSTNRKNSLFKTWHKKHCRKRMMIKKLIPRVYGCFGFTGDAQRKVKDAKYLKQSTDDGAFLPYYISFPLVLLSHFL